VERPTLSCQSWSLRSASITSRLLLRRCAGLSIRTFRENRRSSKSYRLMSVDRMIKRRLFFVIHEYANLGRRSRYLAAARDTASEWPILYMLAPADVLAVGAPGFCLNTMHHRTCTTFSSDHVRLPTSVIPRYRYPFKGPGTLLPSLAASAPGAPAAPDPPTVDASPCLHISGMGEFGSMGLWWTRPIWGYLACEEKNDFQWSSDLFVSVLHGLKVHECEFQECQCGVGK
jgi:hypothetical protein